MKKIKVSAENCIGCGACVAIDPNHFAFNDEGLSHSINNENLESDDLASAIDSCPTCAITLSEDNSETCENKENCECDDACDCGDTCECENCECNKEQ